MRHLTGGQVRQRRSWRRSADGGDLGVARHIIHFCVEGLILIPHSHTSMKERPVPGLVTACEDHKSPSRKRCHRVPMQSSEDWSKRCTLSSLWRTGGCPLQITHDCQVPDAAEPLDHGELHTTVALMFAPQPVCIQNGKLLSTKGIPLSFF
jgi:hypothetical protein